MKIFLTGFMGSGKTFWGRTWSENSGLDFYDLDDVIETAQKKTIANIFEEDGEEYFRKVETAALHTFSEKDNFILASGGGTACFNDNMQWMNEHGTTVYLSAPAEYLYKRVITEKDKRPLINNLNKEELMSFIEQKLSERELFYQQAKIILQIQELTGNFVPDFLITHP